MTPPLLQARSILKHYPGALALDNVDFSVERGEIRCLVGENGAGKSTLMNILAGAVGADGGDILVEGRKVLFTSPRDARRHGIAAIHQDMKLVPELSAAENIFLGHEPVVNRLGFVDRKAILSRARELMDTLREPLDVSLPVRMLSTARRQLVEIAKALSQDVRILILDEPTAPLASEETHTLFDLLRRLKAEGTAIIYISHRLDEVFTIGDSVSVLRDGRIVAESPLQSTDKGSLIRWMVGRDLSEEYPASRRRQNCEILRLEHVSSGMLHDVSLRVYSGEILGIAGLAGAGRTELARVIFGADRLEAGRMSLHGKEYRPLSPQDAISGGIGFLPEDRNRFGLLLQMDVRRNVSLANLKGVMKAGFLHVRKEQEVAEHYADVLSIKPPDVSAAIGTLSGGNRQKVLVARWLFTQSQLLIFDEPTAGIDVGARFDLYQRINRLAEEDRAIVLISSDLPELLGMCDRIAVMCDGAITGIVKRKDATQEIIMTLAAPGSGGGTYAA